jgi:hypothetical protein
MAARQQRAPGKNPIQVNSAHTPWKHNFWAFLGRYSPAGVRGCPGLPYRLVAIARGCLGDSCWDRTSSRMGSRRGS